MEKNYKDLVNLAIDAKKLAYVPYSKFQVGSVLVTKKGIYYDIYELSSYALRNISNHRRGTIVCLF